MMSNLKTTLVLILSILGLSVINQAVAASSAEQLVKSTSTQVISQLKAKHATIKSNPRVTYDIIRRIALPHFDQIGMARSALGRNAWIKASKKQRSQFTKEFTVMVTRTYAKALAEYTNETVKVLPSRHQTNNKKRARVYTKIVRPSGPAISVVYRLVRKGHAWKIYDFSVEGVSMLRSLRKQFSNEIANNGMDQLIKKMARLNRK